MRIKETDNGSGSDKFHKRKSGLSSPTLTRAGASLDACISGLLRPFSEDVRRVVGRRLASLRTMISGVSI